MTLTKELLARLIAYPTVSRDSNLDLIRFVVDYLAGYGLTAELIFNADASKANLHAVIGPGTVPGGVMLSGHTDVVATEAQQWTSDPFRLEERQGRLFGRGTADMKGFIASVLAAVPAMVAANLTRPVHLALSYDEELGCLGVRPMLLRLKDQGVSPAFCIIGEPTEMQVATAHKGKTAAVCDCTGVAAHSALAPSGLNAIHLASDMIGSLRRLQDAIATDSARDEQYSVPHTTVHVGTIAGGTALNIVPSHCRFEFEIRNLPADDPIALMERLRADAHTHVTSLRERYPAAAIDLRVVNAYPALDTGTTHPSVHLMQELARSPVTTKVAFGTEGGLFQEALGLPVVICGPGSMEQGHKADEFVAADQLAQCDAFLARLTATLAA